MDRPIPVVLAGGSGTRLWPVSRTALPKHLAPLVGGHTLFQRTVLRLRRTAPGPFVVVGALAQRLLLERQLAEIGAREDAFLLFEPEGRDTAAAVAVAAMTVAEELGAGRAMWVCPSDHLVTRPEVLERAADLALPAVREGAIATFGIAPDRPETGFGWIELGEELERAGDLALRRVVRFVEKPDRPRAEAMLESGRHVWNSGMFLHRADVLLEELARHAPEIARAARRAFRERSPEGVLPADLFASVPKAPVDKAVMERSARLVVVPCDPGWSDLGSWQALFESEAAEREAVVTHGDVVAEDCRRVYVHAGSRLVAVAGVRDLAVIETEDAVLVAGLDHAAGVKRIAEELAAAGRIEARGHPRAVRPWGVEARIHESEGYRLRELRIDPGATLALAAAGPTLLQVVRGEAEVEGSGEGRVARGGRLELAAGEQARIRNPGPGPLVLVELALGGETPA